MRTSALNASPGYPTSAAWDDGPLREPVASLVETSHPGWASEGSYAWTETPAIEGFFAILTAIAVPLWVTRIAMRAKRWKRSGTGRFAPCDTRTTANSGPRPFLAEKQQDRRGDKDRRRSADDDPENNRQRETAQNLAAD